MNGFTISVPASSANIGPGFDSAGMALNRYLTLHVQESSEWMFEHRSKHLPPAEAAKDHFIYQMAERMASEFEAVLPPCKVIVESEIPLARGMGSSASAVVAGIELANQVCRLELNQEQKLEWATKFEGHPDNVAPALLGGLIITAETKQTDKVEYFQTSNLNMDLVLYIPDFELKTETARKVLPETFSRTDATAASGIGNVMIAGLISGNYELAGRMMEADLFHEPYRASLIQNYDEIRQAAKEMGAYGTVISGAGPTMISFAPKGTGESIVKGMQAVLPDYSVELMEVDRNGLRVEKLQLCK
ncbi:homoserine kinase [Siminovitchia acidinfaciens]|uniref:Homoserine kinase n=1 Tax=Siminovitchia acidinfaciens TaxID=2321395 RepID=A0A429XVE6_9BACI|nr:homoserine kinase [Siminovitchia acidinfaciens]RST72230.1 homoserine kinase [Siminovitchia acidinfaciens]VEF48973.1 homoserine kinase [Bacillus freudenreichii]